MLDGGKHNEEAIAALNGTRPVTNGSTWTIHKKCIKPVKEALQWTSKMYMVNYHQPLTCVYVTDDTQIIEAVRAKPHHITSLIFYQTLRDRVPFFSLSSPPPARPPPALAPRHLSTSKFPPFLSFFLFLLRKQETKTIIKWAKMDGCIAPLPLPTNYSQTWPLHSITTASIKLIYCLQ